MYSSHASQAQKTLLQGDSSEKYSRKLRFQVLAQSTIILSVLVKKISKSQWLLHQVSGEVTCLERIVFISFNYFFKGLVAEKFSWSHFWELLLVQQVRSYSLTKPRTIKVRHQLISHDKDANIDYRVSFRSIQFLGNSELLPALAFFPKQ